MKIKNHQSLAISFALVLLGILMIQAYWIHSVIKIKNKQFDDAVFNALQFTVKAIEQNENITLIKRTVNKKGVKSEKVFNNNHIRYKSEPKKRNSNTVSNSFDYVYSVTDDSGGIEVKTRSKIIQHANGTRVIVSDSDDFNIDINDIMDTSNIDDKLSKIEVLINKIAKGKSNAETIPKGNEIEKIFYHGLKQNNVMLPFWLGVKLNGKELYFSTKADAAALFSSRYRATIFPNDVLKRDAILYVSFPSRTNFIINEMIAVLLLLLLFTCFLLFLFYNTLANFKKQKQLNELKADFINNMTHELKTPLATIQLAADVILKHGVANDALINQMAETIKTQSNKIDNDVRNILQMSLLEHAHSLSLQSTHFNLKQAVEEIQHSFKLIASSKNISFKLNYTGHENIDADKNLIEKAITNLIDNAIKYSYEHGEVSIEVHSTNNILKLMVADNGSGIAMEDIPFVFDKFYRAGKGNIHYNKGYGLGLSFVKKIVEMHHGTVKLNSELRKGTIITIEIPQQHGRA